MRIETAVYRPVPAIRAVEKTRESKAFREGGPADAAAHDGTEKPEGAEDLSHSGTAQGIPHIVLPLSAFAAQFLGQVMRAGRHDPASAAKAYRDIAPHPSRAPIRVI